jgi:hypothetical protein
MRLSNCEISERLLAYTGTAGAHTIPWSYLHYDLGLQGYRTNITEEQLHNAPEFSRNFLNEVTA